MHTKAYNIWNDDKPVIHVIVPSLQVRAARFMRGVETLAFGTINCLQTSLQTNNLLVCTASVGRNEDEILLNASGNIYIYASKKASGNVYVYVFKKSSGNDYVYENLCLRLCSSQSSILAQLERITTDSRLIPQDEARIVL